MYKIALSPSPPSTLLFGKEVEFFPGTWQARKIAVTSDWTQGYPANNGHQSQWEIQIQNIKIKKITRNNKIKKIIRNNKMKKIIRNNKIKKNNEAAF